jgi:hypothetical protein
MQDADDLFPGELVTPVEDIEFNQERESRHVSAEPLHQ